MKIKKNIDLIIQKITGLTKGQLFLNPKIDPKFNLLIDESIRRLKSGEPIEYIINNAEFYSLNFYVDSNVLIPRNDTEIMVDKAIETIIELDKSALIDVGTGSGIIAISIIKNTKKINNCYSVDISRKVLEVTKKNIVKHGLQKRIQTIKSDLLIKFIGNTDYPLCKNLIITANLPYIKTGDFKNISTETIKYEPKLALFGGKNTGFELYEILIKECLLLKKLNNLNNIYLFIEIGFDQKEYSSKYLTKLGLKHNYFKDEGGIERCIKVKF
ncbi:MAG: HemK family protein methyltransferase [Candidatus Gracilibacteria bacterium]